MNKKTLTLADIIAKRNQSKSDKLQVKYYKSEVLGAEIEVRKIPLQRYMELSEDLAEDDINTIDSMNALIYECCPLFKTNTKEAMDVYGVAEPTDLPSVVLEDQLNEIKGIIEMINNFYGLDKITDEQVKN